MTLTIWDCDGVLVDSEVLSSAVEVEMLAEHGVVVDVGTVSARFVGLSEASVRALVAEEWGVTLPSAFSDEVRRRVLARFPAELRPVAGVPDVVRLTPGARAVASSSAPARIALALEVAGLADCFDGHVYSAVEVERGKPAPDLFLLAAERTGWDPAVCTVVEDSVPGVQAGVAAGMRVIGFSGAGHCGDDHAERLRRAGAHELAADSGELARLLRGSRAPTR